MPMGKRPNQAQIMAAATKIMRDWERSLSSSRVWISMNMTAMTAVIPMSWQRMAVKRQIRSSTMILFLPCTTDICCRMRAARRILEIQIQVEHGIYSLKHPDRTALRVGLSPYRGAELLAAIYPEMNRRFPDVEIVPVEGHSGDILKAVRGGEADLSFGAVEGSDRDLKMIPIHREEIVLCVPAFHKLAEFGSRDVTRAPRVRLEEFKDSPFVQIDGSAAVGQITERALRQAGFRPVVVFRSVNVQLVYRIICTGAGVGLIPWYAAVPNREVVYFRLENPVYMIGGVVFRKDHALTQAERYFIYLRIKRYDKRMENTLKNSAGRRNSWTL